MAKSEAKRVTLSHPSGKFTVTVSERRANVLRGRGYTDSKKSAKAPNGGGLSARNELVAKAKELGIPAKGTIAELEAAIAAAEA